MERTNMEIVHPQQRVRLAQHNLHTMDVNKRENWNCYNCRSFEYLARNCRNRNRIGKGRRLEYGGNDNNGQRKIGGENMQQNLNGK